MKRIYIHTSSTEKWGIVMDGNRVEHVTIDRPDSKSQIGNLYKGRIVNIEPSLQAAFVDFGQPKLGFLRKNELPEARIDASLSMERLVHEGQSIVVQVTKDAFDQKGAQLTANVTVPGKHVVYLPFGNYHATSKKIDLERQKELKAHADEVTEEQEGILFRTSAATIEAASWQAELDYLRKWWTALYQSSVNQKPPKLLWEDKDIPFRLLRKYPDYAVEHIYVDEVREAKEIKQHMPRLHDKCSWQSDIEGLLPFTLAQLSRNLTSPIVTLDNGSEIRIDQTEAMVVIDINTAKFTKHQKQQTVRKTNEEAAKEIAHQLKVRNLSGMIVIDFISMKKAGDRDRVIQTLKKALRNDPIRTEVFGFTALGLVEMTRKREGRSLPALLQEPVLEQEASLSPVTYAYQLERELLSYKRYDQSVIAMEVNTRVLEVFKEVIDLEHLKSTLYKAFYVLNNGTSDVPYRVLFIGEKETLEEREFYLHNSIDRVF
ncbi:ribonuclease E/G [Pontibacillus salicampi]|uniref:Ribonuclease E/G n=1 Tax=Pontibacillus salicampi TaxID=1449801 RepID=A0ABV6LJH7_9BACI